MKRRELETDIYSRKYDDRWVLLSPASLVRLGETSRELVKNRKAVDLTRWVTLFIGKSKKECEIWLDNNRDYVLKLSTPYEVASKT